jgi:recombination protein RecA
MKKKVPKAKGNEVMSSADGVSPLLDAEMADYILRLRKKYKKDVVIKAKDVLPPGRISTGIAELDAVIEGGLPMGRVIEVWGPESAGKSSFILKIIAALQQRDPKAKIALYDLENTFDQAWAKRHGVDVERLFVVKGMPVDDFEPLFLRMIREHWDLVIADSVVQMLPEKELAKASDKGTVGVLAGVLSRLLPKVIVLQSMSDTTVVLTNQVRDKIGYYFGGGKGSPGGHALAHDVSLKIRVQRKDKLLGKDLTPEMLTFLGIKKAQPDKEYGYVMALKVVKSKVSTEGEECRIPVLFGRGIWQGPAPLTTTEEEKPSEE